MDKIDIFWYSKLGLDLSAFDEIEKKAITVLFPSLEELFNFLLVSLVDNISQKLKNEKVVQLNRIEQISNFISQSISFAIFIYFSIFLKVGSLKFTICDVCYFYNDCIILW
jgi:hypothetical protein